MHRLSSGDEVQQGRAAAQVWDLLVEAGPQHREAAAAALTAAGAVHALVRLASTGGDAALLTSVPGILAELACDSPRRMAPVIANGGLPALVA